MLLGFGVAVAIGGRTTGRGVGLRGALRTGVGFDADPTAEGAGLTSETTVAGGGWFNDDDGIAGVFACALVELRSGAVSSPNRHR